MTSAPDGYSREMMVINGEFPGPTIEANEGDTIVVNVQNDLSTGTGIRTHRPASVMRFVNLYFFFSLIDWRTLFPAGTAGLTLCLTSPSRRHVSEWYQLGRRCSRRFSVPYSCWFFVHLSIYPHRSVRYVLVSFSHG